MNGWCAPPSTGLPAVRNPHFPQAWNFRPFFHLPGGLRLVNHRRIVNAMNKWWMVGCAMAAWICPVLAETIPTPEPQPPPAASPAVPEAAPVAAPSPTPKPASGNGGRVIVIPIREQIASPELFILRRGLKQAIEEKADTVILDMKTPGGALDVTLEMMEALDRFPGRKITFVNDEAISAGAIIASVTDEIHFSPKSTIGAAEVIMGTGQDVGEGLKRKLNSYMGAKIRAYSDGNPQRANVIRAMMDPEFEFKIGEIVIKPKGELLSLTATEANQTYGNPPAPLLGAGISESVAKLVETLHGSSAEVRHLEVTWSEKAAQYLTAIAPILLGLGMLALFIEFKTPGFGVFGIAGLSLVAIVFLSQYVAGLSGHEPLLVFLLGVVLVAVEIFFFPGTLVAALTGLALMFGSLVWAMLDQWPDQPLSIDGDVLAIPLAKVLGGFVIAIALFLGLLKFLPKGSRLAGFVLETAVGGEPRPGTPLLDAASAPRGSDLLGRTGRAVTALFPSGQVEIDGHRYEARLAVGFAESGTPVRVGKITDFGLIVEVLS